MVTVYCVFVQNWEFTGLDSIHETYKKAEIKIKILEQKQINIHEKDKDIIYIEEHEVE